MIDLLKMHKFFMEQHVKPGDAVVDFTMGNGHDTEYLANLVGESGKVYAFDIQEGAVRNTRERLTKAGVIDRAELILDSHHHVKQYVKEKIKGGMFNLGYLPGSGHKEITTLCETTLAAVQDAISLLDDDGVITLAVYPGHEEGDKEGRMLKEYFSTLDRTLICVTKFRIVNSPTSPYFFVIEHK